MTIKTARNEVRERGWAICWSFVIAVLIVNSAPVLFAATKGHTVAFGKWTYVPWLPGGAADQQKPLPLKVRALLIDARVKEFTLDAPHDITERLFVVRRAFRVNDSLPQENGAPRWKWERGGWLLVDRISGRVSALNLPEFDTFYSAISWYRDYASYCGVSDDGKQIYAIVAQVSRRKPVVKQLIGGKRTTETNLVVDFPDSACPVPVWDRMPARVTFDVPGIMKETVVLRGRAVDLISEQEQSEEAEN
jgi:hypothetical protein